MTDDGTIELESNPLHKRFTGITNHGGLNIDVPYMTEISYNLYQGGCADGLQLPGEIEHVVSLYPWERYSVKHGLKSELYVEMRDAVNQTMELVDTLAKWVNLCRATGPVLVHCQAGLNRSSLIVARALFISDFAEDQWAWMGCHIVDHLRAVRSPACLCNPTFEQEVRSWS